MTASSSNQVAELEGFYGSLHIAERFLQEVWEKQDFDGERLQLGDGRKVSILSPGTWNHQEGPDFRDATLRIGDSRVMGDVELHLYPRDWDRHAHGSDPNYERVVLHVTLFDGPAPTTLSPRVPLLSLLPFLQSDLEGMLTQYALRQTLAVDPREEPWVDHLMRDCATPEQAHLKLMQKARIRWELKRRFAQTRLRRYGWQQSAHQLCLEVLGYRRNRAPMHAIALEHPLRPGPPDWEPEAVFEAHRKEWKLQGIRPANQPFRRLSAYHELLSEYPNWPELLLAQLKPFERVDVDVSELDENPEHLQQFRKQLGVNEILKALESTHLKGRIGGSRLHTLCCDAFLPLFAAQSGQDGFCRWAVWQAGDMPAFLDQVLSLLRLQQIHGAVKCNGWMQGMLQLAIEQE